MHNARCWQALAGEHETLDRQGWLSRLQAHDEAEKMVSELQEDVTAFTAATKLAVPRKRLRGTIDRLCLGCVERACGA